MEVVANNYLPGDQHLVDKIVYELKSQGIFDQFRKECFADVDTKPAYQNLRQRVEGSVSGFLKEQSWKPDMNKNQVREMLRKTITESGYLETGVERIVDQVVNPKINTVFLPKVEEVVYSYLGIQKPNRGESSKSEVNQSDLLPTDLEAVSPESEPVEKKEDVSVELQQELDDSKMEEDESPPFEPLDEPTTDIHQEENSIDSHMSGFSGLVSHESNQSNENNKVVQVEQDSQMSRNSSDSRLSIVTSDDNSKMDICEDSQSKSVKSNDSSHKHDNDKGKSDRYRSSDKHKSRSDSKSDKDRKSSKDSKSRHSSSSKDKDRSKDRDRKDSRSGSKSDKDKPKGDRSRSSSSKHSNGKEKTRKETPSSLKERSDKEKNRSGNHKEKDSKSKQADSKSKSSSSSSDKHKHSSSSSSSHGDKSKDVKRDKDKKKEAKSKDDHYSSKEKKNDRRSTDRDSNDGQSSRQNSSNTENNSFQSQKTAQNSGAITKNGSGDSGNSDSNENMTKSPVILSESIEDSELVISSPDTHKVKLLKPKCASNMQEALRLRKIRRQLAKLEKENQLSLATVDVDTSTLIASSINLDDLNQNVVVKLNEDVEGKEESVTSAMKNAVISQDNWDKMEAELQKTVSTEFQNVSEDSLQDSDGSQEGKVDDDLTEEPCKYFDEVDVEKIEFLKFANDYIARVSLSSIKLLGKHKIVESDLRNNNKKPVPEKKRKTNSFVKKTNEKGVDTDVAINEKFPLPLSPADSDKSVDKKDETVVPLKPKRNNHSKMNNQRYSSDDLYKPRPTFTSSRRRGAKTVEN